MCRPVRTTSFLLARRSCPRKKQVGNLYGPVPVAYLKLASGKNTSIQIGDLPTLMGSGYTLLLVLLAVPWLAPLFY